MMPEWYLVLVALAALSSLGVIWSPLLWTAPLLAGCLAISVIQALRCAAGARFLPRPRATLKLWPRRALTAGLYLLQPLARLVGRVQHGLIFWRHPNGKTWTLPRPWLADLWTRVNIPIEERLESMERTLRREGYRPRRGGDFDRWDLEISGGLLGSARLGLAAEPHGSGRQLLRIICRPRCSLFGLGLGVSLGGLGCAAGLDEAWTISVVLDGAALWVFGLTLRECGSATAGFLRVVRKIERLDPDELAGMETAPASVLGLKPTPPQTIHSRKRQPKTDKDLGS